MSARVVQRYVLDKIDDDRLRTYVVWGPMLGEETEADAPKGSVFLNDPRSSHFWTGAHTLVEALQDPIGLEDEPAWDVFLVYGPGVQWGETPPVPDYYMHHGRSLPEERHLNGNKLFEAVSRLLTARAEETPAAVAGSSK
ncbi:MAG: hypothetical protein AAF560_22705 [Acidobacteriota bacterium]